MRTFEHECKSHDTRVSWGSILINITPRPPFIEVLKDGFLNVTPLSQSNTLCGRSRRFRENAGAIAWDKKRDGSAEIKVFIEKIVQPQNNSTRGSRDLTKIELKKLRLVGNGSKPARANPRSTQGE